MLIRITEACNMGCPHCLADAKPNGKMMEDFIFESAVDLCRRAMSPVIMLSGGEPTLHPNLVEFLRKLRNCKPFDPIVYLLSNGEFLHENPKLRDTVLELVAGVQVTNDPRYYPRKVEPFPHPKIHFETQVARVIPLGRASAGEAPANCQGPQCFNLRSLVKQKGLAFAILFLRSLGKFCSPSIDTDGGVRAGETPFCSRIGFVTDSLPMLEEGLSHAPCDRCKTVSKLAPEARRVFWPEGT